MEIDTAKIPVGILGATGVVGQKFILLLQDHPQFRITHLAASQSRVNAKYGSIAKSGDLSEIHESIKEIRMSAAVPGEFEGCKIIFSALDASAALSVEAAFSQAGFPVFSNTRSYRMHKEVPILIPPVNFRHIRLCVNRDPTSDLGRGMIITNANCASTGLCIALAPLRDLYGGLKKVSVTTLQAISGAGYPGVPSMDILGNVIPFIEDEENKLESEPLKILGQLSPQEDFIAAEQFVISASCHRVPVIDGHMLSVSVEFKSDPPSAGAMLKTVQKAFEDFDASIPTSLTTLPSWPHRIIMVHHDKTRPQPRLDCTDALGMTTHVGRIRLCPVHHVKFCVASHNRIAGAAGGSILNAEYAVYQGLI